MKFCRTKCHSTLALIHLTFTTIAPDRPDAYETTYQLRMLTA